MHSETVHVMNKRRWLGYFKGFYIPLELVEITEYLRDHKHFTKYMSLKILQYSQENTCSEVSF